MGMEWGDCASLTLGHPDAIPINPASTMSRERKAGLGASPSMIGGVLRATGHLAGAK
jgi:hypothetical protein